MYSPELARTKTAAARPKNFRLRMKGVSGFSICLFNPDVRDLGYNSREMLFCARLIIAVAFASVTAHPDGNDSEGRLQTAIAMTAHGDFSEAIPYFVELRGHVDETFALEFNLALCYVGTRQYPLAIKTLTDIHGNKAQTVLVDNLLAQAYVNNGQQDEAWKAFEHAAVLAPKDEKLYVFVSDACLDRRAYELGVRVVDAGLKELPDSARLLFQRGLLRSKLDQLDLANRDFERTRQIAPDSDIGYIAAAQEALLSGDIESAIRISREALRRGHSHYMLLTMLGESLLRAGATPASAAEFGEAQSALERAVAERPDYSSAQIALGKIYLLQRRFSECITHLELARQLDPENPAAYAPLAAAYQRSGNGEKARLVLATLAELNRQDAARIAAAPGAYK